MFLCGMFAGLCYCVTHPIETVKTRVQVTSANSANRKGFFRAFAEIAKTEGKYLYLKHSFYNIFVSDLKGKIFYFWPSGQFAHRSIASHCFCWSCFCFVNLVAFYELANSTYRILGYLVVWHLNAYFSCVCIYIYTYIIVNLIIFHKLILCDIQSECNVIIEAVN